MIRLLFYAVPMVLWIWLLHPPAWAAVVVVVLWFGFLGRLSGED